MSRYGFDQNLYDNFDDVGKIVLRKYLDSKGYYSLIEIEDYGVDIKAIKPIWSELAEYHENQERDAMALRKHLDSKGYYSLVETENCWADIKAIKPFFLDLAEYHEVEVRDTWKGPWPPCWPEVYIPGRKQRLIKVYGEEKLFFWIIAGDFKRAVYLPATKVKEKYLDKRTNRLHEDGEQMFCIPIENVFIINLE